MLFCFKMQIYEIFRYGTSLVARIDEYNLKNRDDN